MKSTGRNLLSMTFLLGCLLFANKAQAQVVYSEGFSTGVRGEWSATSLNTRRSFLTIYHGDFTRTGSTTLTLTGLGAHDQISLAFDLYLFSTWDGEGTTFGKDFFSLSGDVTFSETFTNHQLEGQSYTGSPDECYVGRTQSTCTLDLSRTDVYRELDPTGTGNEFLVSHTGSTFTVTFGGPTTQRDEQWGIDNVTVSISGDADSDGVLDDDDDDDEDGD